ncbi:MAG: hypothetical protein R2788_05525 [Saprospiraceae bacterium]
MFITFLFFDIDFAACIKIILWVHKQNKRKKEARQQRWPLDHKN